MASAAAAGIQCVYRAIRACCTQYSTVPCVLHAPRRHSNSLIAWTACCLLEETPVKIRGGGVGGMGKMGGGGGHAKKPGECD